MLNNYNFKSIFKDELNNFIKFKKSIGFKYENEINRLKRIDDILFDLKLDVKEINKDIFDCLIKRNNMNGNNYARQYGVTKDFCKYLISQNYQNIYYDNKRFNVKNNYQPTLFSKEEMTRLFLSMDQFVSKQINDKDYYNYYAYSIIIRLLYACGIRVCEGLRLEIKDINFNINTINIIDSKRNVSRQIVMSNSMSECLQNYLIKFNIKEGLIFKISYSKLYKFYKEMLVLSNLNQDAHLHDLRHCFVNESLNQMLEKGYDEYVAMVYLYKYLGHKTIKETEYYFHFTDNDRQKILDYNKLLTSELYKGVDVDYE